MNIKVLFKISVGLILKVLVRHFLQLHNNVIQDRKMFTIIVCNL